MENAHSYLLNKNAVTTVFYLTLGNKKLLKEQLVVCVV